MHMAIAILFKIAKVINLHFLLLFKIKAWLQDAEIHLNTQSTNLAISKNSIM